MGSYVIFQACATAKDSAQEKLPPAVLVLLHRGDSTVVLANLILCILPQACRDIQTSTPKNFQFGPHQWLDAASVSDEDACAEDAGAFPQNQGDESARMFFFKRPEDEPSSTASSVSLLLKQGAKVRMTPGVSLAWTRSRQVIFVAVVEDWLKSASRPCMACRHSD